MDDPTRSDPPRDPSSLNPDADATPPASGPSSGSSAGGSSVGREVGANLGPVAESDQKTVISRSPPRSEFPLTAATVQDLGKLLIGQRLGHFLIEEFVGGGGMGAVFRATDAELGRTVAVKVVSGASNDDDTLRRFKNEAQSAARLDHQNIARVYYVGADKGWHYIVFEFIQGVNIRDLVQHKGPLPIEEAVHYTLQVAEALDHASKRNVVHRDIKPSNVLVMPDGTVKLVDMGLARLHQVDATNDLTASGVTLGTFDYISPEQAREPRNADVRSDLYSLGCTLYYMLTGQPPFPQGTVLQKLLSHSSERPPDPRDLRPELGDEVTEIVHRLLAKNPADRYQSPAELVGKLLGLADELGLTLAGRAPTLMVPPAEPISVLLRHLPWMIPTGVLLLVVFLMDLASSSRLLTVERPILPPALVRETSGEGGATAPADSAASPSGTPAAADARPTSPTGTGVPGGEPEVPRAPDGASGRPPAASRTAPPEPASGTAESGTNPATAARGDGNSAVPSGPDDATLTGDPAKRTESPPLDPATITPGLVAGEDSDRPETATNGDENPGGPPGDTLAGPPMPPLRAASGEPGSSSTAAGPTGDALTSNTSQPDGGASPGDTARPTEPLSRPGGTLPPTSSDPTSSAGTPPSPPATESITRIIVAPRSPTLPANAVHASTLSSALARLESLPNLEAIELWFDGELVELPLVVSTKDRVEFRAGAGFQPIIAFRPEVSLLSGNRRMIDLVAGNAVWKGVHFRLELPTTPSQDWALFGLQDLQSVEFHDCTLTIQDDANGAEWHDDVAFFEFLPPRVPRRMDMEMDMTMGAGPMAKSPMSRVPPVVNLNNCAARGQATFLRMAVAHPLHLIWNQGLLITNARLLQMRGATEAFNWDAQVQIQLDHVTAVLDGGLVLAEMNPSAPLLVDLDLELLDSVLVTAAEAPLLEYRGVADLAKAEKTLKLRGDRNFYPTRLPPTPSPRPARRVRWRLTSALGEQREFGFDEKDAEWYEEKTAKESVLWKHFPLGPPTDEPYHLHTKADYQLDAGVRNPARAAGFAFETLPAFPAAAEPRGSTLPLPAFPLPSTATPGPPAP